MAAPSFAELFPRGSGFTSELDFKTTPVCNFIGYFINEANFNVSIWKEVTTSKLSTNGMESLSRITTRSKSKRIGTLSECLENRTRE